MIPQISLNLRTRKVLRDVLGNKSRVLLVVLSIAMGLFALSTTFRAQTILSRDLGESYAAINPASATLLTNRATDDMIEAIESISGIAEAEGQATVWTRIKVGDQDWRLLHLTALPDYDDIEINKLGIQAGDWPPADRTLWIERSYFIKLNARLGDTVLIEAPSGRRRELPIAGITHDLTVVSGSVADQLFYGYVTPETLTWLDVPAGYNKINLAVVDPTADQPLIQEIAHEAEERLEDQGRPVLGTEILRPNTHPMDTVIQSLLLILGSLGLLSLLLSSLLVFNTISALLSRQVQQIGIMKTIGAPQSDIFYMYAATILIFSLLALFIAVPIGVFGARLLTFQLGQLLNFTIQSYQVPGWVLLLEALTGLIVPLLAALYPILNSLRITVREALSRTGRHQFGVSRFDQWVKQVRGLSAAMLYSARNIFRNKMRLTLTLVTLSLGGAIFITVLSVRASLFLTVEEIAAYWQQDLTVDLQRPYRLQKMTQALTQFAPTMGVEGWQTKAAFRVRAEDRESYESSSIFAVPPHSKFIEPRLLEGRWLQPEDQNAIVLNIDFVAKEPDITLNDQITLNIEGQESVWQVVGIATTQIIGIGEPKPEIAIAYVNYDYFNQVVGEVGLANRIVIEAGEVDPATQFNYRLDLEPLLHDQGFHIRNIETHHQARTQIVNLTRPILLLLISMAFLFAVVGGLSLTGTMSLSVLERTQEIGIIRAIGASNSIVTQVVLIEGIFVGLVSWLLASLLAYPFSKVLSIAVGLSFIKIPLTYAFAPQGILFWLVIVLILSILASYIPARRAARLSVREVLSYE
ncbi:MAG: FtsX-like permease family protein [Chloroflexota bacterium]